MHRSLKLHHRRHTGKLIHHRHTSYLALLLVVIGAGLCILLTDSQARAADLSVTATVPAPIPTGKPIFTMPTDGTTVEDPDVHFEGICPVIDPAIIITLHDGSTLLGSGVCQPDGTFGIDATLYEGTRSIVATVVTITGGAGESSDPLTITYKPKSPPIVPSPGTPSTPPVTVKKPLLTLDPKIDPLDIVGKIQFVTVGKQGLAAWKGSFLGGVPPYQVSVDWSDGEKQYYRVTGNDVQTYTHVYKEHRDYDLSISVTDKDGRTLTRNFAVVSIVPSVDDVGLSGMVSPGSDEFIAYLFMTLYSSLLVAVVWLWRYEFLRHRKIVAVPMHYRWQKQHYSRRPDSRKPGKK